MATSGPIHWHEGLFLQPHHLQSMQRHFMEEIAALRRLAWSHPYGLIEARLSPDALENMLVRFDRLRAVMPSGVEVDFPNGADVPPLDIKKVFEASSNAFLVRIGVPLWYGQRANAIETGSADDWRTKRLYRVKEVERPDENTGENPQPMLVRRINARLLLEGDDVTDLEVFPLMRVAHAAGAEVGLPRQDSAFIPPCLVLGGSVTLREQCRDLANQVEASRKELVIQLSRGGFSVDTMRGVQFEQMLRLRTLNRFSGCLGQWVADPSSTPFRMYVALRELLGELAALKPDRDPFDAAAYDHDNPAVAFADLSVKIRALLRGSVSARFLKLPLTREGSLFTAALTDEHLTAPNEYFLAIKTKEDPTVLARLVEDQDKFKLMAKSMAAQRIFGVKLADERHPPVELPAQVGLYYFRLLRADSARMWDRIKDEKAVAVKWPDVEASDFELTLYMTVPV